MSTTFHVSNSTRRTTFTGRNVSRQNRPLRTSVGGRPRVASIRAGMFDFMKTAGGTPPTSAAAAELEDELYQTLRGWTPGRPIAPAKESRLDELVEELGRYGSRSAARSIAGDYKLVYSSSSLPLVAPGIKSQISTFERGSITVSGTTSVLGFLPGSAEKSGEYRAAGQNTLNVRFTNLTLDNAAMGSEEKELDTSLKYTILYLGGDTFVAEIEEVDAEDVAPTLAIFQKVQEEKAAPPQGKEKAAAGGGLAIPARRGLATQAERTYVTKVKGKVDVEKAKRQAEMDKKAAAEARAKQAKAEKAKAEAERAAQQKQKETIQKFLDGLTGKAKDIQAASKSAAAAAKAAERENSGLLKESTQGRKKVAAAEAAVKSVMDEVEKIAEAEKEVAEKLKEAQKELQNLKMQRK